MKSRSLSRWAVLLLLAGASPALAQHGAYTSRASFQSATTHHAVSIENFDGFANGQQLTSLWNGGVRFDSPSPTVFYGGWNGYGTAGQFSGGGLIPEARFNGRPLVLLFDTPVFGLGANVFDDFDGTPFINVLTLTVTTAAGNRISVTENFANVGDTGFLGVTSPDGIVRAEFSIDNTNGNLEIDLLTVAQLQAPPPPGCTTSAECGSGQACSHGTCVAACTNTTWTDLSRADVVVGAVPGPDQRDVPHERVPVRAHGSRPHGAHDSRPGSPLRGGPLWAVAADGPGLLEEKLRAASASPGP
jgi:hypothetical protein